MKGIISWERQVKTIPWSLMIKVDYGKTKHELLCYFPLPSMKYCCQYFLYKSCAPSKLDTHLPLNMDLKSQRKTDKTQVVHWHIKATILLGNLTLFKVIEPNAFLLHVAMVPKGTISTGALIKAKIVLLKYLHNLHVRYNMYKSRSSFWGHNLCNICMFQI